MKKLLAHILFVLACSPFASAIAADVHGHNADDPHAHTALTLNNGKKWETDEALRKGMGNARELIEQHMRASQGKKTTNAEYNGLAEKLQNEVHFIFQNCRLDKKADEVLHTVLADVMHGISVLQGEQKAPRANGVTHIAHALENYITYFDHPNWAALNLH